MADTVSMLNNCSRHIVCRGALGRRRISSKVRPFTALQQPARILLSAKDQTHSCRRAVARRLRGELQFASTAIGIELQDLEI